MSVSVLTKPSSHQNDRAAATVSPTVAGATTTGPAFFGDDDGDDHRDDNNNDHCHRGESASASSFGGSTTVLSPLAPLEELFQAPVSVYDVVVPLSPRSSVAAPGGRSPPAGSGSHSSTSGVGTSSPPRGTVDCHSPRCFDRDDVEEDGGDYEDEDEDDDVLLEEHRPITEEEQRFCRDFEAAWSAFLRRHPGMVPKGPREERILKLQDDVIEISKSTEAAKAELHRQLAFFRSSLAGLEDLFQQQMLRAADDQRAVHDDLQRLFDCTAISDHLQNQTLRWFHFVDSMDAVIETLAAVNSDGDEDYVSPPAAPAATAATAAERECSEGNKNRQQYRPTDDDDNSIVDKPRPGAVKDDASYRENGGGGIDYNISSATSTTTNITIKKLEQQQQQQQQQQPAANVNVTGGVSGIASASASASLRPSARAMALTQHRSLERSDRSDIQLRAYRVDHALLTAHVQMLQRELERLDQTAQTQRAVGKFLTEHNVWGLLRRQQQPERHQHQYPAVAGGGDATTSQYSTSTDGTTRVSKSTGTRTRFVPSGSTTGGGGGDRAGARTGTLLSASNYHQNVIARNAPVETDGKSSIAGKKWKFGGGGDDSLVAPMMAAAEDETAQTLPMTATPSTMAFAGTLAATTTNCSSAVLSMPSSHARVTGPTIAALSPTRTAADRRNSTGGSGSVTTNSCSSKSPKKRQQQQQP